MSEDELGAVLSSLLAVAEAFDMDAEDALGVSLAKYERRLDESGGAASGNAGRGAE